ncbi:MAG: PD-(D/E)XK nuclease family protein [Lachnospiraceae bacterium]|nr:PD-(D/E)XK nuclease family protein [Lachnospiraceae bacterium]
MNNNIFGFALKELSQDAVICWILNCVNYPDSELYGLGCDFFRAISKEEIDRDQKILIYQQKKNADIVVVIPSQRRIIIIEDKVYSTKHDDQINTYKNEFEKMAVQKGVLSIISDIPFDVSTVYLKTGFFYDADRLVKADFIVNGNTFYDIVSNPVYRNKSEILDDYADLFLEMNCQRKKREQEEIFFLIAECQ